MERSEGSRISPQIDPFILLSCSAIYVDNDIYILYPSTQSTTDHGEIGRLQTRHITSIPFPNRDSSSSSVIIEQRMVLYVQYVRPMAER